MMNKLLLWLFVICLYCFFNYSCKHDVAGCTDAEATNRSLHANLNDGSCKFRPFFLNPSFEMCCDWSTYTGTGCSPYAYGSNVSDGFMPTLGQYCFKCIPTPNYMFGTRTIQYVGPNKHTKGFYFDYSYTAIAGPDSILNASINIDYLPIHDNPAHWSRVISETPVSFGGFPNIKMEKKDEYIELNYSENIGEIYIRTSVSKGTFTFQIDNIREVPR